MMPFVHNTDLQIWIWYINKLLHLLRYAYLNIMECCKNGSHFYALVPCRDLITTYLLTFSTACYLLNFSSDNIYIHLSKFHTQSIIACMLVAIAQCLKQQTEISARKNLAPRHRFRSFQDSQRNSTVHQVKDSGYLRRNLPVKTGNNS